MCGEKHTIPPADTVVHTDGTHQHSVVHTGLQPCHQTTRLGSSKSDRVENHVGAIHPNRRSHRRAYAVDTNLVRSRHTVATTHFPSQQRTRSACIVGSYMIYRLAGRTSFNLELVQRDIPRSGCCQRPYGHNVGRPSIASEIDYKLFPIGRRNIYRRNGSKCRHIARIGHHTHLQYRVIR